MKKTQECKLGLTVGIFLAVVHAVWLFAVAVMPSATKSFLDWALKMHHVNLVYALAPFNLLNAVLLVAFAFLVGYVFGWLLGTIYKRVQ
ncbi:hypothetical protein J4219_07120 [Candidatus Woesearchaeota archaeon]|nr:hypothetical protein [Candidatus Woesearchaeota archaeon]